MRELEGLKLCKKQENKNSIINTRRISGINCGVYGDTFWFEYNSASDYPHDVPK